MNVSEAIKEIESFAPLAYQESYDNAGLIVGSPTMTVTGILICLDTLEVIIDEAIQKKCNLIIAHHPIVFSGLKKITGKNYVERVIIKAIKNDIAIYAAHTNLDNIHLGVNKMIGEKLGLQNLKILSPKKQLLKKLHTYAPNEFIQQIQKALFEAGAGNIGNYNECSFLMEGIGTFKGNEQSNPFLGKKGIQSREKETKLEVIFPAHLEQKILQALNSSHPYEEVAYEVILLDNYHQNIGSGMVGTLSQEMEEIEFLYFLKEKMQTKCIRHTQLLGKKIKTIAFCGGAGSFLLPQAKSINADIFITGDYKYHEFFDAEKQIIIADIGHFESEQFTLQLFHTILKEKFPTFALHLTEITTNPVNYL
jgi:dinuclear metal center YbgI/SA1388 family protein